MDKPKFVYVTYISSTPEKVWDALRDSKMTRQYWGNRVNASDWKVGSKWQHRDHDNDRLVDIVGKVLESDPPRRLVVSWSRPADEERAAGVSRVTFELKKVVDTTRLTITHDELEPNSDMLKGITKGWPLVLSGLKTLLETGKPMTMMTTREGWPREE